MKNLLFSQLLVLSNTNKSGNQFEFSKHWNLIKASENTVGKSTVGKLLLWGLGCEPSMDTNWNAQDCETIVDFQIEDTAYSVKRYKNIMSVKTTGKNNKTYEKITGEYSSWFADIVDFKPLLPNQSTGILEVPPPAYYFLPFYIDQKRSWVKAWDNFEKLSQFRAWQNTIMSYHVGLLTPKHFEIEMEVEETKIQLDEKNTIENKLSASLEIVILPIPWTKRLFC